MSVGTPVPAAFTARVKVTGVELALPSLAKRVTVALPAALGVRVRDHAVPEPVSAMPPGGSTVALSLEAVRERAFAGLSTSESVTGIVTGKPAHATCAPTLATTGGSFTAVTVTAMSAVVTRPELSRTLTVTVAVPEALATGVICRVREAVVPEKTRPVLATTAGLEEVAVTVRLATLEKSSPTVRVTEVGVSSRVVTVVAPRLRLGAVWATSVAVEKFQALVVLVTADDWGSTVETDTSRLWKIIPTSSVGPFRGSQLCRM